SIRLEAQAPPCTNSDGDVGHRVVSDPHAQANRPRVRKPQPSLHRQEGLRCGAVALALRGVLTIRVVAAHLGAVALRLVGVLGVRILVREAAQGRNDEEGIQEVELIPELELSPGYSFDARTNQMKLSLRAGRSWQEAGHGRGSEKDGGKLTQKSH